MISIVIPALNEARALPLTLAHLFSLQGDFEVILVDGGSTDATIRVAQEWPEMKLLSSSPGRAQQMNTGATAAKGDLLLFLHADTLLPDSALLTLAELSANRGEDMRPLWGGFRHQFSGDAIGLRAISALHNWRCGLSHVFYGDQAMFVARDLFESLGGFPAVETLEDIMLSETLLQTTKPMLLAERVVTDSRKFEQMGTVRSFCRCLLILVSYELRLPMLGKRFFTAIR